MKEELIKLAQDEGFEFTSRALEILKNNKEPEKNAAELIALCKARKFKISDGDVVKFILRGQLPTALCTSDETDSVMAKLNQIEERIKKIEKKVN